MFRKITFIFLVSFLISGNSSAQFVTWDQLFSLYKSDFQHRQQFALNLGFHFEKDYPLKSGVICKKYAREMVRSGQGQWNEQLTFGEKSKQVIFMTENTSSFDDLKKELINRWGFKELLNTGSEKKVIGIQYVKAGSEIEIYSKPGTDNMTEHYIKINRYEDAGYVDKGKEVREQEALSNSSTGIGENHALIITQNYSDRPEYSMKWPQDDGQRLKDVLINKYKFKSENVEVLNDGNYSQLSEMLIKLRGLDANSNLLIFYAGHGLYDKAADVGYWLPSDFNKATLANTISNQSLISNLKAMQCKHVLVVSDACFSGALFQFLPEQTGNSLNIDEKVNKRSRQAITSAGLVRSPSKSSFINALIDVLSENTLKKFPSSALFMNVEEKLRRSSTEYPQPAFGSLSGTDDYGGEFVFNLE